MLKSLDKPNTHRNDPVTSFEAAERQTRTGRAASQRKAVLAAVRRWPNRTSAELADLMGVSRHMPARRLPELRNEGIIRQGRPKMCSICQSNCVTWYWESKYPLFE